MDQDVITDCMCGVHQVDKPAKITITVENYDNMSDIMKEYLNYFLSACTGLDDQELASALMQMCVK